MRKADIVLLFLVGVLVGVFFVVGIMEVKYGMGSNQMSEEFTAILNELDCDELYKFSFDKGSEFVKDFVVEVCLYGEVEEEEEPYVESNDQSKFMNV